MIVSSISSIEECWVLTGQRRGGIWMLRRRVYTTGKPASAAPQQARSPHDGGVGALLR